VALSAALSASIVIDTLSAVVHAHSEVPFWDQWTVLRRIELIERGAAPLWSTFWEPHAGHRMLIPQLLQYADARWFGYESGLLVLCSLLLQLSVAWLYLRLVLEAPLVWWARLSVAPLVFSMLFSSYCLENFLSPMQISYLLAYAPALWGLKLLCGPEQGRHRVLSLTASLGLGAVASSSMVQGLAFWPAAISILAIQREGRRTLLVFCGLTIVVAAAYLVDYHWLGALAAAPPGGLATSAMRRATVLVLFLGAPASHASPYIAIALGTLFVLLSAYWVRAAFEQGPDARGSQVFLVGSMVFASLCTALIVAGRYSGSSLSALWADLGHFLVVSRYVMVTYYGWLSLLILALHVRWRTALRRQMGLLLVSSVVLMAFGTIPDQLRHSAWWVAFYRRNDAVAGSLIAGVLDRQELGRVAERPVDAFRVSRFLRQRHLAFIAEPRAQWIGKAVDLAGIPRGGCGVSITERTELREGAASGVRFRASVDLAEPLDARAILLVDRGGSIVGVGEPDGGGASRASWLA
jgi:hypothetical protein